MTPYAKSAFPEEDGGAVFSMLDDQGLRPHGQYFLRGTQQVLVAGKHFGFGIVNQQNVDILQRLGEIFSETGDPEIHGIAAGKANTVHLFADLALQHRMNVGEEEELGIKIRLRNTRFEVLEDVELGEVGFRFIQIVEILSAPAKGLAGRALNTASVNAAFLQDVFVIGGEVVAYHRDDANVGKVAGREREVSGGSS